MKNRSDIVDAFIMNLSIAIAQGFGAILSILGWVKKFILTILTGDWRVIDPNFKYYPNSSNLFKHRIRKIRKEVIRTRHSKH